MAKNNAGKSEKLVSRREFLAGSGAVIAAIALAACSPKTTGTTTLTTSTLAPSTLATSTLTPSTLATSTLTPSTLATSTLTPSTLTPKYGGTLRIIAGASPQPTIGWPPEMANSAGASAANQDSCELLLRGDSKGNIVPWLAESYKVADDLKSITFTLRKGVKFHDGSDFNAEVAKWNLDNMIKAKVSSYALWASVDIIDDYTIRVNFTKWQSTLPMSFAEGNPCAPMVSKAAFEKHGLAWMRANPVGTGPFKFESFQLDVSMKLVRNPDYWLKGKPYLDGIETLYVTDPTTQMMTMQVGDGDIITISGGKAAHDYAALGLKVEVVMEDNFHLVPDTANPDSPWANQKVREAVEYAIDKEGIAKALGYGYWQAPYQIPPRASSAYDPNFTLGRKYDLEKAKQLLAEAGYSNGFNMTIISFPNPSVRDVLIALQADLAKVGIQAKLDFPDWGKWMLYMGSGTWSKGDALFTPIPRYDVNFIQGIQFLINMTGKSWLRPPELMQAYADVLASPTVDVKLIRAVTNIITRDALIIPICESGSGRATQPYVVAGFNERFFMAFWNTEDYWFNK